jgi:hypothetical protein
MKNIDSKNLIRKTGSWITIILFTWLILPVISLAQTLHVFPDPPVSNYPMVADIIFSPGDSLYEYEWLVNSVAVKQGRGIQNFRVNFNEGFQPEAGDSCIDSAEVELVTGWYGNAVHVGEGQVHLAYENNHDFSLDSGAVSFWISYDRDISDPIYNNWSTVFSYRIDDKNSLSVQVSQNSYTLIGTSQSNGNYKSIGYLTDEFSFEANKWHLYTWRWNSSTGVHSLYIDGKKISQTDNYVAPVGESGEFIIGSTIWPGSINAFATIDEFRIYSKYLSSAEVMAIYQYPDKDIDAILEDEYFETGDTIVFRYRTNNNGSWSTYSQSENYIVGENPISLSGSLTDVLLPGTTEASFTVKTQDPCICKTDTLNAPYNYMQFDMESSDSASHNFSFTPETDVPYAWFVKCAPTADPENPYLVGEQYNTRLLRDYQPDFPRIFHLYKTWTNNFQYIPKYDVIVTNYVPKKELVKAREKNPNLKVLMFYPFSYGDPYETVFREASNDTTDALYNCLICNSEDSILIETYWKHPMYNLTNPACVEYIAEKILERWSEDLLDYDGIFFDRVHGSMGWMWDDMDINRDGVADDPYVIDEAWKAGVILLLTRLREKAPNAPIVGNDAIIEYAPWINGSLFEVFLSFYLEGWHNEYSRYMNDYIDWSSVHNDSWNLSMVSMGGSRECSQFEPGFTCPQSVIDATREDYKTMRFGLASTLMGDGLYLYDIETPVWGQTWWYDEFDISLGKPLGPAVQGTIWKREFEKGLAIVNPTADTRIVPLGKTYWAFPGEQDPEVNNGSAVTEVVLQPHDGRILLNYNPVSIKVNEGHSSHFYPNPAHDFIKIKSTEPVLIEIYSMLGQLLIKKKIISNEELIPVNNLLPGSYILKAYNETEIYSEILIVK